MTLCLKCATIDKSINKDGRQKVFVGDHSPECILSTLEENKVPPMDPLWKRLRTWFKRTFTRH